MTSEPAFPDYTPVPSSDERPTFEYRPVDEHAAPVVTIVTPYYNTGEVFRDTATSVFRQTMQQWEWLIVNDGSTGERELAVLDEFRRMDPRIRVVDHEENRGPGAARNSGFRAARTDYVVQLDSDDLLEPTLVERLLWFLESHPDYSFAQGYTAGFGAESYVWESGFHGGEAFLEGNLAGITAMVRRSVHHDVGGYDESNRDGLEDWDFWLKCAANGYWGATVHEPLSWYRRRTNHGDQWENWDGADREDAFCRSLQERYPGLWRGEFPTFTREHQEAYEPIPPMPAFENKIRKDRPRILLIIPWMTVGGADKFNLDAVAHLIERGWEVTIATTLDGDHAWEREFARHTPDIHPLHRFLRPVDFPRFLRYLTGSRSPDVVLVSNSELGYQLIPYLRSHHPEATYMDLSHAEQEDWKSGGHPSFSNIYRDQIDLSIVGSEHLRTWMAGRGGDVSRVAVCRLGVDTDHWHPDEAVRRRVRSELSLDDGTALILFAGRLAEEKQPLVLAETMLHLVRMRCDFTAVVVGDGADRSRLEAYVRENALDDRVWILGSVTFDRVRDLFRAADVFFLPSKREGIALSFFEAMACGVPVVGAAVGGQAELVSPEAGVLLDRDEPGREAAAYAAELLKLIEDPQRRADMGAAARARVVEGFSVDAMGERLSALIDEARRFHDEEPRVEVPVGAAQASATLAIEYQRVYRLWEDTQYAPAVVGEESRTAAVPSSRPSSRPVYAMLMGTLGGPYRRLKRRNPRLVIAVRDRVRLLFGYRR